MKMPSWFLVAFVTSRFSSPPRHEEHEETQSGRSVSGVTSAGGRRAYVLIIASRGEKGAPPMLIRFSCLMLALVALVPGALATLSQAAQIIA